MSRQKVKRWQGGDKCYSRGLTSQGHKAWAFQLRTFQRTKFQPTGAKWLFNETVIPYWALEKRERGHRPSLEHDKRAVVFTYIPCDPINRGWEHGELVIYGRGRKNFWGVIEIWIFLMYFFSLRADEAEVEFEKEMLKRGKRNPRLSDALRFNPGSFPKNTVWLSQLGMCHTERVTDYTALNLNYLLEGKILRTRTQKNVKLQTVLKCGDLTADTMLSPENTCWF